MRPDGHLPQPVSRQGLAVLRHPDQTSHWSIVLVASLAEETTPGRLADRVGELQVALPISSARLAGEVWISGSPPDVAVVEGEPLGAPLLTRAYLLEREPPLRVVLGSGGRRVAIAGHHAAFDGLSLVAVLAALLGGPLPEPARDAPARKRGPRVGEALRRLARPADRVAPSAALPPRESFVSREAGVSGRRFTARLAEASVRAIGAHNAQRGWPWRRVGLSVAVGGPTGAGNVASYRRVDVRPDEPVASRVADALADDVEPAELVRAPAAMTILTPFVERLSDSVLVSNIGRHPSLPATRLEFFPVARGRSAVAVGAAGVDAGSAIVTLRARDLDRHDAAAILEQIVASL